MQYIQLIYKIYMLVNLKIMFAGLLNFRCTERVN